MHVILVLALIGGNKVLAFEALLTNERSGDVIHIDTDGSTTHVVPICNRTARDG